MDPTHKALAMLGMAAKDMEQMDFFKRSGRKAAAALRSMGYKRKRFQTMAGRGVYATRWAAPAIGDEFSPPMSWQNLPAFSVLVMAVANDIAVEAK
jgi:hypothetical protein